MPSVLVGRRRHSPDDVASVSAEAFLSSLALTHTSIRGAGNSYIAPLRYLGIRNISDCGRSSSDIQRLHQFTGLALT